MTVCVARGLRKVFSLAAVRIACECVCWYFGVFSRFYSRAGEGCVSVCVRVSVITGWVGLHDAVDLGHES